MTETGKSVNGNAIQPGHCPGVDEAPRLHRALSLPLLTLYGLGTIIGAGIYVLVGKVAGIAGMHAPLAFMVAALAAMFSALSYAELAVRYPKSAGEPVYVAHGLGVPHLPQVVGFMVIISALVSCATIANGFVGYLQEFVAVPRTAVIVGLIVLLGAIAMWGIAESVWVAAIATLIEVAGLLMIIAVCGGSLAELPQRMPELWPLGASAWHGVLLGAFLAFFAFIGFEGMVNVAEEVKNPARDIPRAILLATIVSATLYMLVATVAVLTAGPAELAASEAPLALIYERATGRPAVFISLIGIFAVVNGALILIVTATRVLYGMSREGWVPPIFGAVHPQTRTPHVATAAVSGAVLLFALTMPLVELARLGSLVILLVFVLINLSLLRLKLRAVPAPLGAWCCPAWTPVAGVLVSVILLAVQVLSWM